MKNFVYVILMGLVCSCGQGRPSKDNVTVKGTSTAEESPKASAASDQELIKEAVTTAIDLGKDFIKQHKINDSVREANREQMYAYRIGFPMTDNDQVLEVYSQLGLTDNIWALKQSRKEFYLFYYNGNSKKQLEDSMEIFKSQLPENFRSNVAIVNMMQLCTNSKQKLIRGEDLSKRKSDIEIPCLICDK